MIEISNKTVRHIADEINWDKQVPQYVFNKQKTKKILFLESGFISTKGLIENLLNFNKIEFGGSIIVSVGYERATGNSRDVVMFSVAKETDLAEVRAYWMENSSQLLDRITIATNSSREWILYEDGLVDLAVLAIFSSKNEVSIGLQKLKDHMFTPGDVKKGLQGKNELPTLFDKSFLKDLFKNYNSSESDGIRDDD